ncbi:hypothetical protein IQ215_14140 [Cyanobacterium stanieri LEGE 03274]|uniref:Uncharacterized protein n=1 Tax=Cyanobacterium stanieri LEGE 03274 TaxID=1828756 RepID=A0ABR9V7I3_9CHRO|nr:hypothetical protein [Cyanobacterium stanieri]MBE9223833.1 hypothetical protein [Cyanobacterium stanieri LEGE 03274]
MGEAVFAIKKGLVDMPLLVYILLAGVRGDRTVALHDRTYRQSIFPHRKKPDS